MWNEEYVALTNADQERFTKVVNYLLNKTFMMREVYEPHDKIGKINGDYRFAERYLSLLSSYLEVAGYQLEKDDTYGIIRLLNTYQTNVMHLDKLTTILLLSLRETYDKAREESTARAVIFLSTQDMILTLINQKLITRRPTIKDTTETLRVLVQHNILSRIDGSYESGTATFALYPTILKIVSNDKISVLYKMIFQAENSSESTEIEEGEEA